jgi:hypothetical protein
MDTEKSPEVWDRLSNESGRAYEAFKVYMYMSPAERTVVGAWRLWTENPEAARPSPFFEGWAREYAWSERARAHDHHIELIRERGMEKAIEEEAEFQARQVEQMRFRYNELMSTLYMRAIEWLEDSEWTRSNLRSGDVIKIVSLYQEEKKMAQVEPASLSAEGDWEEDEEGNLAEDAESAEILARVRAAAEARRAAGDDSEPEEGLPGEDGQN